jgi:cell fate (sporulation/competence/biofilm development) regulator YlbF (YheA/YmcA/DUF963 family)
MDDAIIAKARELGALLQKDERYLKFLEAQKTNQNDNELNELIAKLQLAQMTFQQEASKEEKNDARLQELDQEFGQLYNRIMSNPNMQAYEKAAAEIDTLMKYVNGIFTLCLQGEDPATCEPHDDEHHCGCGCEDDHCDCGCGDEGCHHH